MAQFLGKSCRSCAEQTSTSLSATPLRSPTHAAVPVQQRIACRTSASATSSSWGALHRRASALWIQCIPLKTARARDLPSLAPQLCARPISRSSLLALATSLLTALQRLIPLEKPVPTDTELSDVPSADQTCRCLVSSRLFNCTMCPPGRCDQALPAQSILSSAAAGTRNPKQLCDSVSLPWLTQSRSKPLEQTADLERSSDRELYSILLATRMTLASELVEDAQIRQQPTTPPECPAVLLMTVLGQSGLAPACKTMVHKT